MRDAVHAELTALLTPSGRLSTAPPRVAKFFDDQLLHEVVDEYRATQKKVSNSGQVIIVTAGPPGAGKSTAVADFAGHARRIDPDDVKPLLLRRLEAAGALEVRHRHRLADGQSVRPAELSMWIHRDATRVADIVRDIGLQAGEDLVLEGTLAWNGHPQAFRDVFATRVGYERFTIIDVEVARAVACDRARDRWWQGRSAGDLFAGRLVLEADYDHFYVEHHEFSVCAVRARQVRDQLQRLARYVELALVTCDATDTMSAAFVDADDELRPWPVAGVHRDAPAGAPCTVCGALMTTTGEIVAGRHLDHC